MISVLKFSLITVILLCFFCCQNPVQVPVESKSRFDVEKYFNEEVAKLNSQKAGIVKTLFKNGSVEKRTKNNMDWKTELQPFFQIKLNQPAQRNSFKEVTINHNHTVELKYTALDASEKLKKLSIYKKGDTPDSLVAIIESSNIYYFSTDTISYFGNGNYRISTRNKPKLGKEVAFVLEGLSVIEN